MDQMGQSLFISPEATGIYRIEVNAFEKGARPGLYEVKLVELRAAKQTDRDRLAARLAFDEAERLQSKSTPDSLEAALKKYQDALDLYRVIQDRSEQYTMLLGIGNTALTMQQWPLALERFDQALVIAQELKDNFRQYLA